jgi:tetratricopeptide (TPR) repeat protein
MMPKTCVCLFLFLNFFFGVAQEVQQISGRVTDASGKALEQVLVVGPFERVFTNASGAYGILGFPGEEIRFIKSGWQSNSLRVKAKGQTVGDMVISPSRARLNEAKKSKVARPDYSGYFDNAQYVYRQQAGNAIDQITQALSLMGSRGSKKERARVYVLLGDVYAFHKQFELAQTNYKDALTLGSDNYTILKLAQIQMELNRLGEARKTLLAMGDKGLNPYHQIKKEQGLAQIAFELGDFDRAKEAYENARLKAVESGFQSLVLDIDSQLAVLFEAQNNFGKAQASFNNVLEVSRAQPSKRGVLEKEKAADFYSRNQLYDQEIKLRQESLEDLMDLEPDEVEAANAPSPDTLTGQRINFKIANAYIAQDKPEEAVGFLEESIKTADAADDLETQKDAVKALSEVYRETGDYDKALVAYQQYVSVMDTLYARKEAEIEQAARFNREIATKQGRITGLEQEQALVKSQYDLSTTREQLAMETNKRQRWLIYALLLGTFIMAVALFLVYRANLKQKQANRVLALKSLRSQMNPHFIFNALNSVNTFIAQNDERAANRYLTGFSTLMRSVLENSDKDFVPLAKELETLKTYVLLEHQRFKDKFDYQFEIAEGLAVGAYAVPTMLIQPYIENAVWHGLRYKEGFGRLNIDFSEVSDHLMVSITDDGIGREQSMALKTKHQKKKASKGMGNIADRVALLNKMYGNRVSVRIEDLNPDGSGTRVELKIKKGKWD